jgi:hypothetical protein
LNSFVVFTALKFILKLHLGDKEINTTQFEIITITAVKIMKTPAALLVHDYDDMHW